MARFVARALGRYIDGTSWPFHVLAAWLCLTLPYYCIATWGPWFD